jgi:APA family basic amino acid/polyamine antiporter
VVTCGIAVLVGPAAAIALSACSVLVYYGVINVASLRLRPSERSWPRWTAILGLVLCTAFALLLPLTQVLITGAALAVGWTACTFLPLRR